MKTRINFSITQLEYVWALYKQGHFAKAAESCSVTQPTLSMQIQKFEDDLGVKIFDRTKKPILLTQTGQKIINQIQQVLFEANKISSIIDSQKEEDIVGDLVVGIIPTVAPYLLPKLLPVIEKQYPGIRLKILELQTQKIVESLNTDDIDVGVLATPLKLNRVIEHPLYYEPFYLLSNKGHEIAKNKRVKYLTLKVDDIWLLEEGHCLRNQILDICSVKNKSPKKRNFEFESGSIETLKHLVDSYGGYTLIPALALDNLGSNTVIREFDRPIPSREIGLVYQRAHYKENLIESLADAIIKSIPDEIRKIRPKDLDIRPID